MQLSSAKKFVTCFAVMLGLALLAGTLAWHIPFMLWDHLELAPMYQGWMSGHLDQTIFWELQGGGHWHVAAYALLLPAAWLTHGHPWLDCLMSWLFLVAYAAILLRLRARTLPIRNASDFGIALLMVFLILYPGHFFNLQFGYQLAVFLCLFGAAATIAALCAPRLTWSLNFLAIAATTLALLSFAMSYALFVVALVLIALRHELSWRERLLHLVPWFVLGLVVYHFGHRMQSVLPAANPLNVAAYTLSYLGSGISRFVPDSTPWVAVAGLVILVVALHGIRDLRSAMPWLGLLLFAAVGALLTGLGRGFLGDSRGALVPRYVSFSTVFWLGWLGVVARAQADGARVHVAGWSCAIALLALVNAGQLTWSARILGRDSRSVAQTICRQWPNLDRAYLNGLIYSGADAAQEGLRVLHDLDFAPFDACSAQAAAKQ